MDVIKNYKSTRQKLFDDAGIQPESLVANTKGLTKNVHYLKIGMGKPLILIHGGGSHSSEWINILKPLAGHFELYVVDRPGCGLTDFIDYREVAIRESAINFVDSFMDAVGLQKAALLGQSMGGYFSLCFSFEKPERVEKLLLIGAPAGMNLWIPYMLRLLGTKGLNSFLMKTMAKPGISGVRNIFKQLLVAEISKVSNTLIENTYYNQLLPGTFKSFCTLLENVLTLRGWRRDLYIGDQLNQLKIPVSFIWGDKDAFESPESGISKASKIKDYRFEVVKNAGHSPWLDQPEQCSKLIIDMLK